MRSWIITLPKTVKWEYYQKELNACADWSTEMSYRLRYRPKAAIGDRCFVLWNGKIRGWMKVVIVHQSPEFKCSTTGKIWPRGWYITRSGPFNLVDGPEMKGFRGIREYV